MRKTFNTPEPTSVYVEIGTGRVAVHATETDTTEVEVAGRHADDVTVEQQGDQIVVIGPRRAGFLPFDNDNDLAVTVTLPLDSELSTKLGSADVRASGRLGAVRIKCGSGDVSLDEVGQDTVVQSGSGDIRLDTARGDLRVKTGSGSTQLGLVTASTVVVSGSGRIVIDSAAGETVAKSGSGDVRIGSTDHHVSMTSGSGDLEVASISRGSVKAKTASGDVAVGVPAGVPVWTDVSTVTGDVSSNLEGAGRPEEGQDHVEIRATSVSGDVVLTQL